MLGFKYGWRVIRSVWRKLTDGTLTAVGFYSLDNSPEVHHLIEPGQDGYLRLRASEIRLTAFAHLHDIIKDKAAWDEFSLRIEPCFGYRPDLLPFETGSTYLSTRTEASWFEGQNFDVIEYEIAPHELIRLDLIKIRKRYPQAEDDPVGDCDVRAKVSALLVVFFENYRRLLKNRLNIITGAMIMGFVSMALAAGAAGWLVRRFMTGFDVTQVQPLERWIADPNLIALAMVLIIGLAIVPLGIMHWAQAELRHHKNRYDASTAGSTAAVSMLLTTRQENICALVRQMFAHKDHDKEAFWAQGQTNRWADNIPRWEGMIFWNHARLGANLEYLRIHTKIIGLIYVGLRSVARFKAMMLLLVMGGLTGLGAAAMAVMMLRMTFQGRL
jgi:AcrR family transcriptional regulator